MPLTDKQAFEVNHEVRISCVLREQLAKPDLRKVFSALTNMTLTSAQLQEPSTVASLQWQPAIVRIVAILQGVAHRSSPTKGVKQVELPWEHSYAGTARV
jgi:hypothetical protein